MIRGVHTMFYCSDAEGLRSFLREKLGFPAIDVGEGWLIFDLPEADMGVHPTDDPGSPPSGTPHVSFYCDDIEKTMKGLKAKGVEFVEDVQNHGYGLVTFFKMPGGFTAQLYQPLYEKKKTKKPVKKAKAKPRAAKKGSKKKVKAAR